MSRRELSSFALAAVVLASVAWGCGPLGEQTETRGAETYRDGRCNNVTQATFASCLGQKQGHITDRSLALRQSLRGDYHVTVLEANHVCPGAMLGEDSNELPTCNPLPSAIGVVLMSENYDACELTLDANGETASGDCLDRPSLNTIFDEKGCQYTNECSFSFTPLYKTAGAADWSYAQAGYWDMYAIQGKMVLAYDYPDGFDFGNLVTRDGQIVFWDNAQTLAKPTSGTLSEYKIPDSRENREKLAACKYLSEEEGTPYGLHVIGNISLKPDYTSSKGRYTGVGMPETQPSWQTMCQLYVAQLIRDRVNPPAAAAAPEPAQSSPASTL